MCKKIVLSWTKKFIITYIPLKIKKHNKKNWIQSLCKINTILCKILSHYIIILIKSHLVNRFIIKTSLLWIKGQKLKSWCRKLNQHLAKKTSWYKYRKIWRLSHQIWNQGILKSRQSSHHLNIAHKLKEAKLSQTT